MRNFADLLHVVLAKSLKPASFAVFLAAATAAGAASLFAIHVPAA